MLLAFFISLFLALRRLCRLCVRKDPKPADVGCILPPGDRRTGAHSSELFPAILSFQVSGGHLGACRVQHTLMADEADDLSQSLAIF